MIPYMLSFLILSPIVGIIFLQFVESSNEKMIKIVGVLATLPALFCSLYIFIHHQLGGDLLVYSEAFEWFRFGNFGDQYKLLYAIDYEVGVDGLSLIMLVLTSLLATLAAVASYQIKKEWKGYFSLFLLLEIGMLGVFAAQNLVLFFLFFELTLISAFFLIGKWGYFSKENAAYSFLIYNGIGSAILLFVIGTLFARTGTTNIEALRYFLTTDGITLMAPISSQMKYGLLIALLVAFGIKLPVFPLHSWMLKVHVQAPVPVVMLHAGVLLKIGAYGIIRFGITLFPQQFENIGIWIAVLGVINLLFGAFLALIQTDLKMVLAYSSISHMGIVLMGLGALNEAGVQGAIFQVVSHGLIAALLFFLVGVMYERLETTTLGELGGLAKLMPKLAGFFLVGGMASLGLPGMSGFVSEFMAFLGLFEKEPILATVGTLGIVLTATYILRAILGITFGAVRVPATTKIWTDMKRFEWIPALILTGVIVLIGVYPAVLSDPLQQVLQILVSGWGG